MINFSLAFRFVFHRHLFACHLPCTHIQHIMHRIYQCCAYCFCRSWRILFEEMYVFGLIVFFSVCVVLVFAQSYVQTHPCLPYPHIQPTYTYICLYIYAHIYYVELLGAEAAGGAWLGDQGIDCKVHTPAVTTARNAAHCICCKAELPSCHLPGRKLFAELCE